MPAHHAPVICTVDVVLLSVRPTGLHVLLRERDREPSAGCLALPGGYIHTDADTDAAQAARRVLLDKVGITSPYLEQLSTFSGPERDPRGWSVSIAHYALVAADALPPDGDGVINLAVDALPALPFDHSTIVAAAVARLRAKSQYSSLPVYLCGERFTLPQLQAVYEAVLGEPINKVSFRRRVEELDMVEAVPGERQEGRANRPAQLYRLRNGMPSGVSVLDRGLSPQTPRE